MNMTLPEIKGRKGFITLSLERSGTNWLKYICVATGEMGAAAESMGIEHLEKPLRTYSAQSYFDFVMQHASTPNGRFSMKLFPRHLRYAQAKFGFDFIRKCAQENDVKFYLITREDRLGQAISAVKARQSQNWIDKGEKLLDVQHRKMRYNFRKLCHYYFFIGQEFDFWRSYLNINSYEFEAFSYESLLPNPAPFFESAAKHLSVSPPKNYESTLNIQRNAQTEEWRQRFLQDIETHGVHPDTYNLRQPEPSFSNALKVLAQRPIKPARGGG